MIGKTLLRQPIVNQVAKASTAVVGSYNVKNSIVNPLQSTKVKDSTQPTLNALSHTEFFSPPALTSKRVSYTQSKVSNYKFQTSSSAIQNMNKLGKTKKTKPQNTEQKRPIKSAPILAKLTESAKKFPELQSYLNSCNMLDLLDQSFNDYMTLAENADQIMEGEDSESVEKLTNQVIVKSHGLEGPENSDGPEGPDDTNDTNENEKTEGNRGPEGEKKAKREWKKDAIKTGKQIAQVAIDQGSDILADYLVPSELATIKDLNLVLTKLKNEDVKLFNETLAKCKEAEQHIIDKTKETITKLSENPNRPDNHAELIQLLEENLDQVLATNRLQQESLEYIIDMIDKMPDTSHFSLDNYLSSRKLKIGCSALAVYYGFGIAAKTVIGLGVGLLYNNKLTNDESLEMVGAYQAKIKEVQDKTNHILQTITNLQVTPKQFTMTDVVFAATMSTLGFALSTYNKKLIEEIPSAVAEKIMPSALHGIPAMVSKSLLGLPIALMKKDIPLKTTPYVTKEALKQSAESGKIKETNLENRAQNEELSAEILNQVASNVEEANEFLESVVNKWNDSRKEQKKAFGISQFFRNFFKPSVEENLTAADLEEEKRLTTRWRISHPSFYENRSYDTDDSPVSNETTPQMTTPSTDEDLTQKL